MSSRVDSLVAINDMILNNFDNCRDEFKNKANILVDALCKVITNIFDRPLDEIPLRFAKYFLNVVHKVCSTRHIMKELSESTVF